ncbi:hypothetical protein M2283_009492, partial [Streptomyces pseudovenezuelae]|nr:hypothetical protein [Streptomyces pseudovenezuelae]
VPTRRPAPVHQSSPAPPPPPPGQQPRRPKLPTEEPHPSRTRPRPRRRCRPRAPPRCFHLRPHVLLPEPDLVFVTFHRATGRAMPGPAVAVQKSPHSRDRATALELAADQRSEAFQGPPLIFPALRGQPFGQLLFQQGEPFVRQLRQFRPFDLRPSIPPSRQSRRHCSTERSLTRRSLAMSEVLSPHSNLCPASSRIPSRAARRSAVRPPPSAYRITPAYRRDHPTSPPEGNPKRSVEDPSLAIIDTQSVRAAADVPKTTTGLGANKNSNGDTSTKELGTCRSTPSLSQTS